MKSNSLKIIIAFVFIVLGFVIWWTAKDYLTFSYLKQASNDWLIYVEKNYITAALCFFIGYVIVTAFSLPGAAVLTLASGALFGLINGVIIVSFASTIGASLSFLLVRFIIADWARQKFYDTFKKIDQGVNQDGPLYLLSLRLIPLFPFFVINAISGLTNISLKNFYIYSQLGMLPGTIAYVWAGVQLATISDLSEILSAKVLSVFFVLGIVPFLSKKILETINNRKIYKTFNRPQKFQYNVVVIGGGAAGLVTTAIAANTKAKVAIIESNKMGGDCLNYGCVPSKTLIYLSKNQSLLKAEEIQLRIEDVIKKIEPNDSEERFTKLGADVFKGYAKILDPYRLQVGDQVITTSHIVIAAGAEPIVPLIPGLNEVKYFTSETIWDLKSLPSQLLIVGGGSIGCELAQAFARLGKKVTLVEKGERLLSREEPEASNIIAKQMQNLKVNLLLSTEIIKFENGQAVLKNQTNVFTEDAPAVLFALGRKARIKGYGVEELGIKTTEKGFIISNEYLQTNFPNIYVCGDVAGPIQLTHVAGHQAWYAAVNALFGSLKKFKQNLSVIPRVTFTYPEVASVGLSEIEAQNRGQDFETTFLEISEIDRARCEFFSDGYIKVMTQKGSDRILGVSIVSPVAGEMLSEFTFAMNNKLGLKKILSTVHAYPTWSDANKMAALSWQRKNIPTKLQKIAEVYHEWKRR